jgi:hypothetical protein
MKTFHTVAVVDASGTRVRTEFDITKVRELLGDSTAKKLSEPNTLYAVQLIPDPSSKLVLKRVGDNVIAYGTTWKSWNCKDAIIMCYDGFRDLTGITLDIGQTISVALNIISCSNC